MGRRNSSAGREGFTLIEVLVVITIIGILATMILTNFGPSRAKARDVQRKSDLDQFKKSLRMYYNDNNTYPNSIPNTGLPFVGQGGMVYMKLVPGDPTTGTPYGYYRTSCTAGTEDFRLVATLENKSDSSLEKSHSHCSDDCGFTWNTTDKNQYVVCAD